MPTPIQKIKSVSTANNLGTRAPFSFQNPYAIAGVNNPVSTQVSRVVSNDVVLSNTIGRAGAHSLMKDDSDKSLLGN